MPPRQSVLVELPRLVDLAIGYPEVRSNPIPQSSFKSVVRLERSCELQHPPQCPAHHHSAAGPH